MNRPGLPAVRGRTSRGRRRARPHQRVKRMADLYKVDEERLRRLEKTATMVKIVGVVIGGVVAAAIVWIGNAVFNLASTLGEVREIRAQNARELGRIELHIDRLDDRLEKRQSAGARFVTLEGELAAAKAGKLTVLDAEGQEHTVRVSADARVFAGGKESRLSDLAPGTPVRVELLPGPGGPAVLIEALSKAGRLKGKS